MRLLLAAALLLTACSKAPAPGQAAYSPKDGSFSLSAPAEWRVAEDQGEGQRVSFFGPPGSFSESIGVYFYEATTLESYQAARPGAGPLASRPDGRFEFTASPFSPALHGRPPSQLAVRHVLIPSGNALWALVHTRPAGRPPGTAFDELCASFQPKS